MINIKEITGQEARNFGITKELQETDKQEQQAFIGASLKHVENMIKSGRAKELMIDPKSGKIVIASVSAGGTCYVLNPNSKGVSCKIKKVFGLPFMSSTIKKIDAVRDYPVVSLADFRSVVVEEYEGDDAELCESSSSSGRSEKAGRFLQDHFAGRNVQELQHTELHIVWERIWKPNKDSLDYKKMRFSYDINRDRTERLTVVEVPQQGK